MGLEASREKRIYHEDTQYVTGIWCFYTDAGGRSEYKFEIDDENNLVGVGRSLKQSLLKWTLMFQYTIETSQTDNHTIIHWIEYGLDEPQHELGRAWATLTGKEKKRMSGTYTTTGGKTFQFHATRKHSEKPQSKKRVTTAPTILGITVSKICQAEAYNRRHQKDEWSRSSYESLMKKRIILVYRTKHKVGIVGSHHAIGFSYLTKIMDGSGKKKVKMMYIVDIRVIEHASGEQEVILNLINSKNFTDWQKDREFCFCCSIMEIKLAASRAFDTFGDYHLLNNNCQHFCDNLLNDLQEDFSQYVTRIATEDHETLQSVQVIDFKQATVVTPALLEELEVIESESEDGSGYSDDYNYIDENSDFTGTNGNYIPRIVNIRPSNTPSQIGAGGLNQIMAESGSSLSVSVGNGLLNT